MRIVENRAIALTIRHPRPAPEPVPAAAPITSRAIAPAARPSVCRARDATPDSGFVMQLIATAAAHRASDPPPPHAVGMAYGGVERATKPPRSGDRIARSI